MNKDFTVQDWVDALDVTTEYAVPEDVKGKLHALGKEIYTLCAEHDIPCVVAFASKMNANTIGIEHLYHLYPLERVPMELLLMSAMCKSGSQPACQLGLDLIKYLNGEPIDDQ